ncbi:MAG: response regulator transcription factor [Anaerolineae bacterium]|nr:response regulator transcription factor [Anaerolineae bacterium]
MRDNPLVLIVEDEPRISRYLRSSLQMSNYDVLVAADGVKALELVQENQPDLVLLDIGLPRMNGFDVLEHIRKQSDIPVIVLTALDSEDDKVKALMMGADDYVPKPFGNRELQARIVAVLRRYQIAEPTAKKQTSYQNGGLRIDFSTREVTVDGRQIHLTPTEYRLLATMSENTNRVLTHDYLLTHVWGVEYSDDVHILRATIWRLRQKIEGDAANPTYIVNEPGIGYRLAIHNGSSAD